MSTRPQVFPFLPTTIEDLSGSPSLVLSAEVLQYLNYVSTFVKKIASEGLLLLVTVEIKIEFSIFKDTYSS